MLGTHLIATMIDWPTHVSSNAVMLAAARLDPIEALRFE